MERYCKTSSSKWQSRYSEEFKRFVCNEFLTGTVTRREVEDKYHIGHSRITYWLKELGYDYSKPDGKNSVNVGTVEGTTHFDLDGATHKGVETPHVQKSYKNVNPKTGEIHINKDRKNVRPMTQQDIRTVRKVLEKRKQNDN